MTRRQDAQKSWASPARRRQVPGVSPPSAEATTLCIASSPGPVIGSLCTGAGGLDLGVLAAFGGGRIAWCADPDPHVTRILAARMPGVPNLGDIRAIDWSRVEPVDVLTAGFPCQDISSAGRRAGIEKGTRSGLWTDVVVAVRVLRPAFLVVENVAALRWKGGGLDRVLGDLADTGYDAAWRSVRAADIGAAHRRERVFLLAWSRPARGHAADASRPRRQLQRHQRHQPARWSIVTGSASSAAHTNSGQPERQRAPGPLAATTGEAPGAEDQRQRDGHAAVHRGQVAPDTDGLGREELHPPHPTGRRVAARRDSAAADPTSLGHRNGRASGRRGVPSAVVPASATAGGSRHSPEDPAPDAEGDRRDQGLSGPTRFQRRPDVALGGHPPGVSARHRSHLTATEVAATDDSSHASPRSAESAVRADVDWGVYAAAVHRWEQVLGRPAPHPTQPGRHGRPVLSPAFVEYLMGLPQGWVTDLPLPRTAQLRALGNGVVPQQAMYALSLLLADLHQILPMTPLGRSTASPASETSTATGACRAA